MEAGGARASFRADEVVVASLRAEELRDAFLLWSGGKEKIPREKMHDALTKLGNKFTESEFEAFMGDGAVRTAPSSSAPQSPNRLPVSCMQHCAR